MSFYNLHNECPHQRLLGVKRACFAADMHIMYFSFYWQRELLD